MLWTRGQRLLGQDSFAYLAMAKEFAIAPPDHFGNWWPHGYPLAGSLLTHLGLPAYHALMVVTAGAFFFLLLATWRLLPAGSRSNPVTILLFTAVAISPLCAQLMVTNLSEPFFAAALFALVMSLDSWPKRWAICASLGLALLAFSIRYAGVFSFGVVGLYAMMRWKDLRAAGNLVFLLVALAATFAITAALLWTNFRVFGRITGPQPVGEESLWTWPLHFAQFGWSVVGGFSSSHLIARAEVLSPLLVYAIGFAAMGAISLLLLASWTSPVSRMSRPLVFLCGAYILAIVSLRASTPFDALSFPRFFLPICFPLLYLLATRERMMRSRLFAGIVCASLLASSALAVRGVSAEQLNDLSTIREALKSALKPSDDVAVNQPARNLAAYLPNRFDHIGNKEGHSNSWTISPRNWEPNRTTHTVLATRPTGSAPGERTFQKSELETVTSAVESGQVELVFRNSEGLVVKARRLEKTPAGVSP